LADPAQAARPVGRADVRRAHVLVIRDSVPTQLEQRSAAMAQRDTFNDRAEMDPAA
jgi:hypothetical protein